MTVVIFTISNERILLNLSTFYGIIWLLYFKANSIKTLQKLVDVRNSTCGLLCADTQNYLRTILSPNFESELKIKLLSCLQVSFSFMFSTNVSLETQKYELIFFIYSTLPNDFEINMATLVTFAWSLCVNKTKFLILFILWMKILELEYKR